MSKLLQMSTPTSSFFAPRSQRPTPVRCRYFGTPNGCMNGDACRYLHDTPSNHPITTVGGTNQVDQLGHPGEVVTGGQIAAFERRIMGSIYRLTKAANDAVATNTRHHVETRQAVAAAGVETRQAVAAAGVETRQAVAAVGASIEDTIARNHNAQLLDNDEKHKNALALADARHAAFMAMFTQTKPVQQTDDEQKRAELLASL
jgi:hypothetical protein